MKRQHATPPKRTFELRSDTGVVFRGQAPPQWEAMPDVIVIREIYTGAARPAFRVFQKQPDAGPITTYRQGTVERLVAMDPDAAAPSPRARRKARQARIAAAGVELARHLLKDL